METFDLPPNLVAEAFQVKARYPQLSANDCFCLVTARCYNRAILLTGDNALRRAATEDNCRVHGVLWVIDEIKRLALCDNQRLSTALEEWQRDQTVFLPSAEIERRLRALRHS